MFKCEADWAYAMFLKQIASQKNAKVNPNRARVHSLKRFKSAFKNAKALPVSDLDTLSKLEVEAYVL